MNETDEGNDQSTKDNLNSFETSKSPWGPSSVQYNYL